jgi:hypothetical protein
MGKVIFPSGKVIFTSGKVIFPSGKVIFPSGKVIFPSGKVIFPPGKIASASAKALIINEKTFFSEVNSQRMAVHSPFPAKIACQAARWGRKRRRGRNCGRKPVAPGHGDQALAGAATRTAA